MAESMVVELQLQNLSTVLGGLRQVSQAVASINGVMAKSKNAGVMIQQATINALTITGGNITINQKGGAGTGSAGKSGTSGGPAQRLQKAFDNLQKSKSSGNAAQMFDAQSNHLQAQKAFNRAQKALNPPVPDSLMKRLGGVLSSSRFSMGGKGGGPSLMPLVGQTLKAITPELTALVGAEAMAAVGVIAAPVAIIVGAFAAVGAAATNAAQAITEFRDSMIISGGTGKETGVMGSIGDFSGVKDMASAAQALADKLGTDGAAQAFGRQAGITDRSGPFSKLDKATTLIKAIEHIRSQSISDEEAKRFARAEGLQAFLKTRDASDEIYKNMMKSGEKLGALMTPENARAAANLNAENIRLSNETEAAKLKVEMKLIVGWTWVIGKLADWYEFVNKLLDKMGFGADDKNKPHTNAIDRNTKASEDNTAALKSGIFGGGERARGAMPSAWGGANFKNWGPGEASKLGAFAI